MQFTIESQAFKDAFGLVSRLVPSRPVKPILASVKLTLRDEQLVFQATDNDIGIRHTLPLAGVAGDGSLLLPKSHLDSILKSVSGSTIDFNVGDREVAVASGPARWQLLTEDPNLWPDVRSFQATAFHSLLSGDFRKAVKRTAHALDPKSQQYALSGHYVETSPTSLTLVATSGRSLAIQEVPASFMGEYDEPKYQRIIPEKTADFLVKILPSSGMGGMEIGWPDQNTAAFRWEHTEVVSRLCEGRFPLFRMFLPQQTSFTIPVQAKTFRMAVEAAAAFRDEHSSRVTLAFSEGLIRLSGAREEVGNSQVDFPVEYTGESVSLDLDPAFLIGMLDAFEEGQTVSLKVTSPIQPVVIECEGGFVGAIATMSQEGR